MSHCSEVLTQTFGPLVLQTPNHPLYVLEKYCTPNQNIHFLDIVRLITSFHSALTHQQETILSDGIFTEVSQIK